MKGEFRRQKTEDRRKAELNARGQEKSRRFKVLGPRQKRRNRIEGLIFNDALTTQVLALLHPFKEEPPRTHRALKTRPTYHPSAAPFHPSAFLLHPSLKVPP
jgi:hypothetical protein